MEMTRVMRHMTGRHAGIGVCWLLMLFVTLGLIGSVTQVESYKSRLAKLQLNMQTKVLKCQFEPDSVTVTIPSTLTRTRTVVELQTITEVQTTTVEVAAMASATSEFPKRIWQSWKKPLLDVTETQKTWVRTWLDLNPTYRYEFFSDASAEQTIRDVYGQDGLNDLDRLDFYLSLGDTILRADIFRYLMLYAFGGLWTDFDTTCVVPISEWIPSGFDQTTMNLVLGVEYEDFGTQQIHLVQWTLLTKPRQDIWLRIVDASKSRLELKALEQGKFLKDLTLKFAEVLEVTGPELFTEQIFMELSRILGKEVTRTAMEIMGLSDPVLFGSILLLPQKAFNPAGGVVKEPGVLVKHEFLSSWFKDRVGTPWAFAEDNEKTTASLDSSSLELPSLPASESLRGNRLPATPAAELFADSSPTGPTTSISKNGSVSPEMGSVLSVSEMAIGLATDPVDPSLI